MDFKNNRMEDHNEYNFSSIYFIRSRRGRYWGIIFLWQVQSQSDFILGGKRLPGWALAFSERATGESAWLLLGYTGFVFMTGLSGIWVAVGIAIGIIFAWVFLAKIFMRETQKHNVLTLTDLLAVRFGQKANRIAGWQVLEYPGSSSFM